MLDVIFHKNLVFDIRVSICLVQTVIVEDQEVEIELSREKLVQNFILVLTCSQNVIIIIADYVEFTIEKLDLVPLKLFLVSRILIVVFGYFGSDFFI